MSDNHRIWSIPVFLRSLMYLPVIFLCLVRCNAGTESINDEKTSDTVLHIAADTTKPVTLHTTSGIAFDSSAIEGFLNSYPVFREFRNDYDNFYRANKYNYAWYDKKGLIETAHALLSQTQHEETEGVNPKVPYRDEFMQLLNYSDPVQESRQQKPDIITELMLTGQYFNYAKNIWGGKLSNDLEKINWYLPKKKLSYAALLEKNISNPALAETEAVIPQYTAMKNELSRYREMQKKGIETVVPALKKSLKPNDSTSVISFVRKRLHELGDLREDNGNNEYDPALSNAVNQFKRRHGMKTDSIITSAMITDMNVPIKKRIEQIMVNMERFRWIPTDIIDGEFILVNIPGYMLYHYEDGKIAWDCNVVVGTPMTKTVIFSGDMKYVVFSPYWYIPKSIINKEVNPGMKRNSNYLTAHRMEWNGGNVRQKPGPFNSLGLVKFLFPNSNSIYLHDTPSKSLFGEDQRAFSHGCIRVSKPKELAIRILRQDSSWNEQKITAAMNAGTERYVTLKNKIPVYIGYFTAFVDRDGLLNFRRDVYQRDASLLNMLIQN